MDFATKYRPNSIEEFAGEQQRRIAQELFDSVAHNEPIQKLLLLGKSGIGKTSLAQFYANLLDANIEHINCVDNAQVDYVRDLIQRLRYPSLFAKYTVYLLDELQGWSGKAQEAILIDLEQLPKHVILLAASTEPEKLKDTLKSRFKTYVLGLPNERELKSLMLRIFDNEGIKVDSKTVGRVVEDGVIKISPAYAKDILASSESNIRTLVTLIESVVAGTFEPLTIEEPDKKSVVQEIWQDVVMGKIRFDYLVDDYLACTNSLCFYALGILKRDGSNILARKILTVFGNGLSNNVPPEIAFYKNLIKLYDNI